MAIEWVILGDGQVRLACADCLDVLPTLETGSVDAVITDPPYSSGGQFRGDRLQGTIAKYVNSDSNQRQFRHEFSGDTRDQRSFFAWCSLWLCAARHASSAGGVLCSFIDWRQLPVMTDSVQAGGWSWRNLSTWWKPGCRMQRGRFSSSAEYVIYATNGPHDPEDGENSPQNVFAFQPVNGDDKIHIAEKPIEVVLWILGVARPKCVVLDPFMGSGTTAVAAVRTGRKFIGCEIDKRCFDISIGRIESALADDRAGLYVAAEQQQFEMFVEQ